MQSLHLLKTDLAKNDSVKILGEGQKAVSWTTEILKIRLFLKIPD